MRPESGWVSTIAADALAPFSTRPLTHCGLVMPYGDRDLGQHWLR